MILRLPRLTKKQFLKGKFLKSDLNSPFLSFLSPRNYIKMEVNKYLRSYKVSSYIKKRVGSGVSVSESDDNIVAQSGTGEVSVRNLS